jgi:hypothetical protein
MDDGTTELDIVEVGVDELTIALLEGIALLVVDEIKLEVVVVLDSTIFVEDSTIVFEVVVGTIDDSTVVVVVGALDEEVMIGATVVLDVVGSGELVVGSIELVVGSIELVVGSIECEGLADLVVGVAVVVVGLAAVIVVVLSAEAVEDSSIAVVVVVSSKVGATDRSVLEDLFSSTDVVTGYSVEVTSLLVLLVTFSVLESVDVDAA